MKQGSFHRRTVSENQDLFDTKQRRLDYQSTTWAPVVGWRQINIIKFLKIKTMTDNKLINGIAEIFKTNNQNIVNKEVLNKIAEKMEDLESLIEITISTTSSKFPSIEARISKGQGSTSEWTLVTEEVIINIIKAFRTQDPELLKTKEEIKVEATEVNLKQELAKALIANRCLYSYVAYKNREEVDCYMVTFYISKNRRFKVSLTKNDDTTKLINA